MPEPVSNAVAVEPRAPTHRAGPGGPDGPDGPDIVLPDPASLVAETLDA